MLGYTEIGTSHPKPDCIERNALHQGCIFCTHPCTGPHRGAYSVHTPALLHTGVYILYTPLHCCATRNLLGGGEGKKECLVGFNSREAGTGGGFCFTTSVGWLVLAHSSTKGSRQSPLLCRPICIHQHSTVCAGRPER